MADVLDLCSNMLRRSPQSPSTVSTMQSRPPSSVNSRDSGYADSDEGLGRQRRLGSRRKRGSADLDLMEVLTGSPAKQRGTAHSSTLFRRYDDQCAEPRTPGSMGAKSTASPSRSSPSSGFVPLAQVCLDLRFQTLILA